MLKVKGLIITSFLKDFIEMISREIAKKGFGIGLSMAQSLVEVFNGKLNVEYKKE